MTILSIIDYSIVVIDFIFALAARMRNKLGEKSVIFAIICLFVIGFGVAVGAKFLSNGDNQTLVLVVTPIASTIISVSTLTAKVTAVSSATRTTPSKSNPTATPTPGVTPASRLTPAPRLTPTPPIKIPVVTPTPICQAPCDDNFPDTGVPLKINGPAIVEWADPPNDTNPGCGIYELNAGNSFSWDSAGHYWLYPDQASLNSAWPGHLQDYQNKPGNGSCIVGSPP